MIYVSIHRHQCLKCFNPHLVWLLRIHRSVGGKENGVVRLAAAGDAPGVEVMGVAKLPKNGPKSLRKVLQKGLNRPKWWNKPGKFDSDSICNNIFCFLAGKDVQQRCFGPLHKRPKLDTLVLCSASPPGTKPHSLALETQILRTPWSCESLKRLRHLQY